jgi:type II secretory pathway pseudopilin PulG
MVIVCIALGVFLATALYALNRGIDAHFKAQQAIWDYQVAVTLYIIEHGEYPPPDAMVAHQRRTP